jgi:hypothetical protein
MDESDANLYLLVVSPWDECLNELAKLSEKT